MGSVTASLASLSGWKNKMAYCNDCYSYIDGPKYDRKSGAFVCPICASIIADNPSMLLAWNETQDQEI
jgi:hypothetical protein